MMVFCQSHSSKLRLILEDGRIQVLHYATKAERDFDAAFYRSHGFKVK